MKPRFTAALFCARRSTVVELYRIQAHTTDDFGLVHAGTIPLKGDASFPVGVCFDRWQDTMNGVDGVVLKFMFLV